MKEGWLSKEWYVCTMEYYTIMKKNEGDLCA